MNVFTIAAEKILKTRTKGQLLGQNRAEVLFIGRGSGGQISQHKNCVRSLSNPKPMFSTVLELTTTRFMTKRRSKFACGKFSALPRSRCCLLFSLHARVYLTFPLTKTYGYGRLCDRCNYMETAFFAIVCDCLRSAIVCDRLRLYGNQPLDRTWFYLLRSSAITIAGSQTIAEVFPYDRRPYCDLRSAICDHMETSLKGWFPYDRRSQTVADDRKKGCFHIIATIAEPTVAIRFGQRKCQIYTRV